MLIYLLRSIKARWLENLAIVFVYIVVVATGTLIVAFATNMRDLAVIGGNPSTVVVLSRGANQLHGSSIGKTGYEWVKVRPEIEQRDGTTLISPELYISTQLRTAEGLAIFAGVRGVEPVAFAVHDAVRIVKGRAPEPGSDEVLIGTKLENSFPNFAVGGKWHGHPIVGVFESGGSLLEQEIWIDRQRLILELGRRASEPVGYAYLKTKSPADAAAIVSYINQSKEPLTGFLEPEYLKNVSGDSAALLRLAILFSLLLALGAGIASVNTLYSSLLGRLPEFAALHAIGVRRRRLAGLILQESVLLALAGIAISVAVCLSLDGLHISRLWTNHPFQQIPLSVGTTPIGFGVGTGLAVGIVGGLLAGLSIFRVDMGKYR